MLKAYLQNLFEKASHGDAREESFYSVLEGLLTEFAISSGKNNICITTLPKKTEAGNPDFRVWDGKQHIVGYIEAKEPSVNLDQVVTSDQLKRYLHVFPNLILTNFYEFRLFRNGVLVDQVLIGRPFVAQKLKSVPPIENEAKFNTLLEQYFSFAIPKTSTAKSLAIELAKRTRFLRDQIIAEELKEEQIAGRQTLESFYKAFKDHLIASLTLEDFSNLFAQTITYGLFAARTRSGENFNRKLAYDNIPHTIGILRELFKFVSMGDLPQQMEWTIDDIADVLASADVKSILDKYFHEHKGKDPIVHFYETFLTEYDPATREKRGVYYTPEPVVSYIVRSLNHILKEQFDKKEGFASEKVTVLDPAAGTTTFLAETAKVAVSEFTAKWGDGGREDLIRNHILNDFYAFEIMMAPYAIGHLKMSFLLEELGYTLKEDDRFKLYLTNTLEMEELNQSEMPGMISLSEESHLAGKVKKEQPVLVIIGNPPYSGHSTNKGDWISKEIKEYYQVDGKPLGEKNPKWLQDDYVKFIRFAQWKIAQAGEGILGFITNHSYLDNPTFRGMRQSLMNTFNEIYLLDLHGNSLKKEKHPDGSKDENVFDIMQGVAIALFIKKKDGRGCQVYHSERFGLREKKYDWLEKNDLTTTKWKKITPKSEFYLFVPRNEKLLEEYEKYPKITDIFPVNSVGIVTSRDEFVIDCDKEALKRRIRMFCDEKMPDEIISQTFNLKDKANWKLKDIRKRLREDENRENAITKILYRPFDTRWIFYHDELIERSRKEVMGNMLRGENIALITNRQIRMESIQHSFITDEATDLHVMETAHASAYVFPLFIYPDDLFSQNKKANINEQLYDELKSILKKDIEPEFLFSYIYAVLFSDIYRKKYSEFLKLDFPRVPFTNDFKLFKKLADLGEKLVSLHLLKSPELDPPIAKFQGKGDNKVDKLIYEKKRVYINKEQYFEGITPEIWQYHIGGYQVCDKWLKDRKGRTLSLDDIKHYCKIATTLAKTLDLQAKIDKLYPEIEKNLLNKD